MHQLYCSLNRQIMNYVCLSRMQRTLTFFWTISNECHNVGLTVQHFFKYDSHGMQSSSIRPTFISVYYLEKYHAAVEVFFFELWFHFERGPFPRINVMIIRIISKVNSCDAFIILFIIIIIAVISHPLVGSLVGWISGWMWRKSRPLNCAENLNE